MGTFDKLLQQWIELDMDTDALVQVFGHTPQRAELVRNLNRKLYQEVESNKRLATYLLNAPPDKLLRDWWRKRAGILASEDDLEFVLNGIDLDAVTIWRLLETIWNRPNREKPYSVRYFRLPLIDLQNQLLKNSQHPLRPRGLGFDSVMADVQRSVEEARKRQEENKRREEAG